MAHKTHEVSGKNIALAKDRVSQINADSVKMTSAGAREVKSRDFVATSSAVQYVTAEKAAFSNSVVGAVRGDDVQIDHSVSFAVQAKVVKAQELHAVVVNAGEIQGNVQTMFDKESALAFGLGVGIVLIVWRFLKAIFGR